MKNYKKLTTFMIIISIFCCVFFQSVAYSALESNFKITGEAIARLATDVRITDFKISDKNTSTNFISEYEKFSRNTVSSALTFLSDETVYFDVEVTNYNSNKVYVNGLFNLPENLSISVGPDINEILDGVGTMTFTIGLSGTGKVIFDIGFVFETTLNITYNDFSGSGYPDTVLTNDENVIDFGDEEVSEVSMTVAGVEYTDFVLEDNILTFGPVDGDVVITKENLIDVVSGDVDTVGSEICIDTECFYVISSDDTSVVMLSKYNLYVGGTYDGSSWTAYGEEATGIQNPTMIGYVSGETVYNGTTKFATGEDIKLSYEGSTIEGYVNNYNTYLLTFGIAIEEARLITSDELVALGCSGSSCSGAPSWVYSTSYWSGTTYRTDSAYYVRESIFSNTTCTINNRYGVRPVIVIPKSEF